MKQIVVYFLIISFLQLSGCYYQEHVVAADYNFDENVDLIISANDTTFRFNGSEYFLSNDTLHCTTGIIKIDRSTKKIQTVQIPVNHIEKVEVSRVDALSTTFIITGAIIVLIIAIGVIVVDGPDVGNFLSN